MDFYEEFFLIKGSRKLTYNDFSKSLKMTPSALRMAVTRKRLTDLEKEKLATDFNMKYSENELVSEPKELYKIPLEKYHPLEIVEHIYKNKDKFLELESFKNLIKNEEKT